MEEPTFLDFFEELLLTTGLNDREIAELLSMDQGTLSRIRNGKRLPTRSQVADLISLFDLDETQTRHIRFLLLKANHQKKQVEASNVLFHTNQAADIQRLIHELKKQNRLFLKLLDHAARSESLLNKLLKALETKTKH